VTAVTQDGLLGGRVRHAQPAAGFRSGIEPVLLAAATPARPGESVLEAGSGAGAGLLCLAGRVPGIVGLGIERDADLVAIATANAAANGFDGLRFEAADLLAGPVGTGFHHAFANPPYHADDGTPSPDARRRMAKGAPPGLLAAWCGALAAALRPRGTLTLILPAARFSEATAALRGAGCGGLTLVPLWPRAGVPAKMVLLAGRRDSRAPDRLATGLVLHAADGGFTAAAAAILRDGAALML
jgi:tRNA1(Val) A37 N6-methylase TrmN6